MFFVGVVPLEFRGHLQEAGRFTNSEVRTMIPYPDDPCMVYSPTKLGHLWGKCR